jgi:hypothetical protein
MDHRLFGPAETYLVRHTAIGSTEKIAESLYDSAGGDSELEVAC